jgi:hypothetical protein
MTFESTNDSSRFRLPLVPSVFLALTSGVSALWFSRSYYFNSDRVGWGSPSADRDQSIFWWGTVISIALLVLSTTVAAIRSARFRISVAGATTLAGILILAGQRPGLRFLSWPLVPGIYAAIMALGVHSDFRTWTGLLWIFGINTVFYAAIIAGILAQVNQRKRLHAKGQELGAKS